MSRLDHPNIVKVFGGCLEPPVLFTVTELMVGDLSKHLHGKLREPLKLNETLSIAIDVITGLVGDSVACWRLKVGRICQSVFRAGSSSTVLIFRCTFMAWKSSTEI